MIPIKTRQELIDKVIDQINYDVVSGDVSAIEELLKFVDSKYLMGYLPGNTYEYLLPDNSVNKY